MLSNMKVPPLREHLIEQNLYDAKLSPINSPSMISKSSIRSLLELLLTNFYFAAAIRQVWNEAIRVTVLNRHALEGNRKKKAINKRPRILGSSIKAPIAASGLDIPRVTVISLRSANPSNKEVKIILVPPAVFAPLGHCLSISSS